MNAITPANPDFNFLNLLAHAAMLQDRNEKNPDLFSLSPLSSVPSDVDSDDPPTLHLPPPHSALLDAPPPSTPLHAAMNTSESGRSSQSNCLKDPKPHLRSSTPPPTQGQVSDGKCQRNKEHSQANRKKRRKEEKKKEPYAHYQVRTKTTERYVDQAIPVPCAIDLQEIKAASSGFVGKDDGCRSSRKLSLQHVINSLNFTLQKWDGVKSIPIVDKTRRLVALLAGRPDDPDWAQMHREAVDALEQKRHRCRMPKPKKNKRKKPRRGTFVALSCGVSHGGGQERPMNLRQSAPNAEVLNELNGMRVFKRLAGFVLAAVATWAPLLHHHYAEKLGKLHNERPELECVFDRALFSAYTYNFGPQTVCFKHKDFGNLPYGWCAITSFGDFDYTKGGHLILWELHLVIEFPPGSTVLIPSAVISHSNTTIQPHEHRYSFAQYSAGGLFRWVENGFQTADAYYNGLSPEEQAQHSERNAERWIHGLTLLPIIPERKEEVG